MRRVWAAMEPGERIAATLFVLLMSSVLIDDWMLRRLWVFWKIPLAILWASALIFAVIYVGVSLRDGEGWARKVRGAVAIPLVMAGAALLLLSGAGRVVAASVFLFAHGEEMEIAQARAGPGQAVAIPYLEGVPDGGVAIIRSAISPGALPVHVQMRLTGERIRSCRPILFAAFVCGYD